MQKFNFLLPSFAILCTFYFSSCEGEVEFLDLNNIDYKTATNDEELKFSKIAKNERGKIRLLECYIKDDS